MSTACQSTTSPKQTPSASSAPDAVFSSIAEAQAATRAVYVRYAAASDAILQAGGSDASSIRPYVTPAEYSREVAGFKALAKQEWRLTGHTTVGPVRIRSADLNTGLVTAYVCVDNSHSKIIDSDGRDVTPKDRPASQTTLARLVWRSGDLLIDENGPWSGQSIC